jgi:predicted Ser/Thr protein kinase
LSCPWCTEGRPTTSELPSGATLADGRYHVLEVIGRGGFGITYEAGDDRLRRRVAIKELFPEAAVRQGGAVVVPSHARPAFQASMDRFLREARVLARFTHPGVVRVYEVFEERGTAYLVMERLHARTLIDVMRTRGEPFTEEEVLDVAGRVAAALRPVHVAGVLHRDLNPSNVMLTEHGRIVLIDFGLARDFDLEQTVGMTRVVTPGYAPLEQYRGEARFGPPTDVYGLAATCYRLATGRVPVAAIERDGGAPLPPPHHLNPAISKALSDGLLDGLELEPSHRPQDLDALLARIGVRQLPTAPRSVLLGRPGAQFEPLVADAPVGPAPAAAPLADPGPAVPLVAPISGDVTELVAPVAPLPDHTQVDGTQVGLDRTRSERAPSSVPRTTFDLPRPGQGIEPPGRAKVVGPAVAAAVAVTGALPVLGTVLLAMVGLPALATMGDTVVRQRRDGGYVVVRFVRNAGVSIVRASPIIGIAALLLGLWYLAAGATISRAVTDVLLRVLGMGTAGALWLALRDGSDRFRTGVGIRALVERGAPGGRTTERLVIWWVLAAAVVAGALWLAPHPFPLP